MIVIEGPDASGKTTLARFLAQALSRPLKFGEGPPLHFEDMQDRLQRYSRLAPNFIYDRHPIVSEEIYSHALDRVPTVTRQQVSDFYAANPTIIYCDTQRDRHTHELGPHDTPVYLERLHDNMDLLIQTYRSWAISHAHIIYRIGDDMQRVADFLTSFTADIGDFHQRFGIDYIGPPRYLPEDMHDFRLKFMAEELCEYAGVPSSVKRQIQDLLHTFKGDTSLHDQFDGLIDLVYVALGTAHLHGFPFSDGWSMVHQANMKKVRVLRAEDSTRSSSYDVIKPPGFVPPDLSFLLGPSPPSRTDLNP